MPDNGPVIVTGIVERYWAPEETRPGRLVLRADDQEETVDLKIWLERETRAKPRYLKELEDALGDVHLLEGQRILAQARPAPEYNGRTQFNLVSVQRDTKNDDVASVAPNTPAPAPQVAAWGSVDERIAWNSAVNNAAHAESIASTGENIPLHIWLDLVDQRANGLYPLIRRGPVAPVQEVEPEEPEDPEVDTPDNQGVMKV